MNCASKAVLSYQEKKTCTYSNTPHADPVVLFSCFGLCRILLVWATYVRQFHLQCSHHAAVVVCLTRGRISRLHCLWQIEMNMAAQNEVTTACHALLLRLPLCFDACQHKHTHTTLPWQFSSQVLLASEISAAGPDSSSKSTCTSLYFNCWSNVLIVLAVLRCHNIIHWFLAQMLQYISNAFRYNCCESKGKSVTLPQALWNPAIEWDSKKTREQQKHRNYHTGNPCWPRLWIHLLPSPGILTFHWKWIVIDCVYIITIYAYLIYNDIYIYMQLYIYIYYIIIIYFIYIKLLSQGCNQTIFVSTAE